MHTTRLPYTTYNMQAAGLLGLVLAAYAVPLASVQQQMRAHAAAGRPGWEGEAAGLGVTLLLLLCLYTVPFFLAALASALERGSRPVSGWLLFLGLLPTLLLVMLLGVG